MMGVIITCNPLPQSHWSRHFQAYNRLERSRRLVKRSRWSLCGTKNKGKTDYQKDLEDEEHEEYLQIKKEMQLAEAEASYVKNEPVEPQQSSNVTIE